jgi:hypothetical protein
MDQLQIVIGWIIRLFISAIIFWMNRFVIFSSYRRHSYGVALAVLPVVFYWIGWVYLKNMENDPLTFKMDLKYSLLAIVLSLVFNLILWILMILAKRNLIY